MNVPGTDKAPGFDRSAVERRARRVIASFEAAKGLAALAAGIGLLSLFHYNIVHVASALIGHFGLNPEARYPAIFLHYADVLEDANLRTLMLIVAGYIVLRLVEAFGLWNGKAWAEWLGAVSGGIYIPFEARHLIEHPTLINAAVLVFNCIVVAFLAWQLWRRRSGSGLDARLA
jgi:uncharacterized membrane protein (DUF2068 family)